MKNSLRLTAFALACALSFGGVAVAQAQNDNTVSSAQPGTDTWITTKVKAELATTEGVKNTDISVTTVSGVVTLTGVLATDVAVKKAVAATGSIKGVTKVDSSGLKSKS